MALDPDVEDSQIVGPDFERPVYDNELPPHASQDSRKLPLGINILPVIDIHEEDAF
jgi:hypothetical protein